MNTRLARNVLIALLALSIAACTSAESDVTGVDVDTVKGTISVGVTSIGSTDFVLTVFLNGPQGFSPRTAPLSLGGTVTFAGLEPGTYTVGTTIFGFDCPSVSANVQGNQTTPANIACARKTVTATGIVTGMVTGGGAPIGGAVVELASPGVVLTRNTAANGHLSFVGVPTGQYTLTASVQHFNCPVQSIDVGPDRMTTANISCTSKPTGAITGIVHIPSDQFESAIVELAGPVTRTVTAGLLLHPTSFAFDELPPGTYRLTATVSDMTCHAVSAEVQVARTTTVEISCVNNPPDGSELVGTWGYYRPSPIQTGICPGPVPDTGSGSVALRSSNMIEIVGLDPELAIVGHYDGDSGMFAGSGATVRGDGSTLQSEVILDFYVNPWNYGGVQYYADGTWTRRHRDPSGTLVCTEVYAASGGQTY